MYPQFAASYLVVDGKTAAFIENNTSHACKKLLGALGAAGLTAHQVEFLIITHVHLDHAAGTSSLLRECPNATVLAHPKAAKRVIDPQKLIESARKVYGNALFDSLYGEIEPVPADRVRSLKDGESVKFGSGEFNFIYTLGHATHHFCIHYPQAKAIFTGDSFGLRYPALQKAGHFFILPSTSPVDFDPEEARKSLDKIEGTGAEKAFLTHFGDIENLNDAKSQLKEHLAFHEKVLHEARLRKDLKGESLASFCEQKLRTYFQDYFKKKNFPADERTWELLKLDLQLNGAGIAFVAERG
jgi:glyoxylase-like metal-dependent hydrolase (beta-lactamase superfamily II)